MARALAAAALAGAVLVPIVVIAVRSLVGPASPGSVLIGSSAGTLFLSLSGIVTLVAGEGRQLRSLLIRSYVIKVLILALFGLLLTESNVDVGAFTTSVVASAATFLTVQTAFVVRNR